MRFLISNLDGKQRRLYLGFESMKLGHGGDKLISRITGVNPKTVARGRSELQAKNITPGRNRRAGAGRPPLKKIEVIELLNTLMEQSTAGDPMSAKKWSRKDTRSISKEMRAEGIDLCPNSVGKLLKDQGYSLRVNQKTIAETHHPDRNQQFEDEGQPILSVDTKKKELVGNFKNPGKSWGKTGEDVFAHDFRSEAVAIASPYGLYDVCLNSGTVVVGTSSDTPEFAVDCLGLWLNEFGWNTYPNMKKLQLLCDSGDSNGYRPRLWKYQLHTQIAQRHGLEITVCHYPPGASQWNPVEHRLFSFINMEWAGYPLRSIDLMLGYICGKTTQTGLEVNAFFNPKTHMKGKKVSNSEFNSMSLKRHEILSAWNYTITPGCH